MSRRESTVSIRRTIRGTWLLCFVLTPSVFWLTHFHAFVTIKEFVFAASVLLCLALFGIAAIRDRAVTIRNTRLSLAVLAYAVYNLLSFFILPYTDGVWFFLFTCLILLFYLVSSTIDAPSQDRIMYGLMAVALLTALYTIAQFFGKDVYALSHLYFGTVKIGQIEGSRPFATFGHPNLSGGFYVFMLPALAAYLFQSIRKKRYWKTGSLTIILLLSGLALFLSRTRGAWIAGGFSVCLLCVIILKKPLFTIMTTHRWQCGFLAGICMVGIIGGGLFITRHTSLTDLTSWGIRAEYYRNTWRMIRERPVWGRGFGTFNVYYPLYRDERKAYQLEEMTGNYRVEHPHNEHLELLHDGGIVGYGLFLWVVIEALIMLMRAGSLIHTGFAMSLMGLLIDGLLSQNLRYIVIASLFWLLIGFANATGAKKTYRWTPRQMPRMVNILAMLCLLGVIILPIRFAYRRMQADEAVRIGMGLYEQQRFQEAIDWFRQTIAYETGHKRARYYLAFSYNATGQKDQAFQEYQRLRERDPNFLQINHHLANLELDYHKTDDAAYYLQQHIAVHNMDWNAYYQLALIENYLEHPDRAIAYLNEIESIHQIQQVKRKDYIHVKKTLAQLYINMEEWENALRILHNLRTIAPEEEWIDAVIQRIKTQEKP